MKLRENSFIIMIFNVNSLYFDELILQVPTPVHLSTYESCERTLMNPDRPGIYMKRSTTRTCVTLTNTCCVSHVDWCNTTVLVCCQCNNHHDRLYSRQNMKK